MAGDWIKMRVDLGDDPAVIGISEMLGLSEDTVVGKLHRLWSWADKHTTNGATNGVSLRWVDRFVANQGFADALCKFNWLQIDGDTLIFPNFDRHNGASAKARVEATLRQRLSRKNRDEGVAGVSQQISDKRVTQALPEKRREEKRIKDKNKARPTDAKEVTEYARSIGYILDGQMFIDHYKGCGWVRGKAQTPIKDWRACVRTWKGRQSEQHQLISGGDDYGAWRKVGAQSGIHPLKNESDRDYIARVKKETGNG